MKVNHPDPQRIAELYLLKKSKGLTAPQQAELEAWVKAGSPKRALLIDKPIEEYLKSIASLEEKDEEIIRRIVNEEEEVLDPGEVLEHTGDKAGVKQRLDRIIFADFKQPSWYQKVFLQHKTGWLVAATIALIAFIVVLLYSRTFRQMYPGEISSTVVDSIYTPGNERAILTTSSGRRITLGEGSISLSDGGSSITSDSFVIKYSNIDKHGELNNTISTKLGGMYKLYLTDGTVVWLNAGSELTYPTYFAGPNRYVQLNGEAFFEVAKNKEMPFIVTTDKYSVKVTGTHFNIRAYKGERESFTTLVEGSVTVSDVRNKVDLQPGEASVLYSETPGVIKKVRANINGDIAWKMGDFYFRGARLEAAAKEIGAWYAVEIDSEFLPEVSVNMVISRSEPLEAVLKALALANNLKYSHLNGKIVITRNNEKNNN